MTERGLPNDRHSRSVEVVPSEPLPCLRTKLTVGEGCPGVSDRSLWSRKCDPAYGYARLP